MEEIKQIDIIQLDENNHCVSANCIYEKGEKTVEHEFDNDEERMNFFTNIKDFKYNKDKRSIEAIIYKVYVKTDNNKCITDIWSTGNQALGDIRTEEEMQELGYIQIDEGVDGEIYGRAQVNYLPMKYGLPTYDEKMRCNFSYVDEVHTLTEEEKEKFYPPVVPEPTFIELQNDVNIDVDFRLSMLEMGI